MRQREKILVVDDDSDILRLLRKILEGEQFEVIECLSAENALEILENQVPDLVISDLRMPGMSGVDFINELREWDSKLPVIFVSGWGKEDEWLEAIHTHASALIPKPFHKETILEAVHKAFREKEPLN